MNGFFRDYGWVVRFAVAAVVAALVAVILNRWLAAELAPFTVVDTPTYSSASTDSKEERQSSNSETRPESWADLIDERCLFGCADQSSGPDGCPEGCPDGEVCQNGSCQPEQPPDKPKKKGDSGAPEKSDLEITVMGAMVAGEADYSRAIVHDEQAKRTFLVRVGDELPVGATVVRIDRNRVYIRHEGELEYLALKNTIAGDPAPSTSLNESATSSLAGSASVGRAAARVKGASDDSSDQQAAADRSDAAEEVLSEKKVEDALEHPEQLARSANFTKEFDEKSGREEGLKVVGVSPSSLLSEMGVESGDVIRSVNGENLTSKRDAMEIIERLREEKQAHVEIERNGEPVEREFRVE